MITHSRAIALCISLALLCQGGHARGLQQVNPFLASPATSSSDEPNPPTSNVVDSPTGEVIPAIEPATEPSPVAEGGDGCACTTDGLSGGANTTRIGCGQWDVISGSNAFSCYVQVSPIAGMGKVARIMPCRLGRTRILPGRAQQTADGQTPVSPPHPHAPTHSPSFTPAPKNVGSRYLRLFSVVPVVALPRGGFSGLLC